MLHKWQRELLTINRPCIVRDMHATGDLFDLLQGCRIITEQQVANIQAGSFL